MVETLGAESGTYIGSSGGLSDRNRDSKLDGYLMGKSFGEEVGYILGGSSNLMSGGQAEVRADVMESKSSSIWNWMIGFGKEMLVG